MGELHRGPTKRQPRFVTEQGYPLEANGYGTDGQQYLFIAHDPLVRRGSMAPFLDAPTYRYRRILLPALASATCGGSSPCIPRAIIACNLLFAAGIGALLTLLVRARGAHWGWALMLSLGGALVCATDIAGVELCAQFFGLLGVWLASERRPAWAALAFAFAPLARETYALVPLGFALAALHERRPRDAIAYGASLAPLAAWVLFLGTRLPPDRGPGGWANLGPPLMGILSHVRDFLVTRRVTSLTLLAVAVAVPLLVMMARHARAVRRDRSGLACAALAFSLLGLCCSAPVWVSPGGFARALDFLWPAITLCALSRGDRLTAALSAASLLYSASLVGDHVVVALR